MLKHAQKLELLAEFSGDCSQNETALRTIIHKKLDVLILTAQFAAWTSLTKQK